MPPRCEVRTLHTSELSQRGNREDQGCDLARRTAERAPAFQEPEVCGETRHKDAHVREHAPWAPRRPAFIRTDGAGGAVVG